MELNGTPASGAEVAALSVAVAGPVLRPQDEGFAAECATFNLLSTVRPGIVVGATSPADVQAAIGFARDRNLPVAVLTTGHQTVRSAEGAVLINTARMNTVNVDPVRRLARVDGGTRWHQVLPETDTYDLAPLSGTSPTVGVVGYHLGGGASPILGRRYGYAADHIQALEVVTADGRLRRVTADTEQDLFWARRGGKGNYGVVTALEFSLFPLSTLHGGGLFFAGEHAAKVLHSWRDWVTDLPDDTSSSVAFLRMPPMPAVPEPLRGRFVLHVRFASLRPRDEAEALLAPIRAIAGTVMDTVGELRYRESSSIFMDPPRPVPWVERSAALREVTVETIDALLAELGPGSDTGLGFAELRPLGGALVGPPEVPNAVTGRDARWSLFASGGGRPELAPVFEEQLTSLTRAVTPWTQDQIMPNLLSNRQGTTPEQVRAIYGPERYDRLARIKALYDPRNMFRMNHNIPTGLMPPSTSVGDASPPALSDLNATARPERG